MTVTVSDRIEKKIVLKAPLARVWRAISDAGEFGEWFGLEFDRGFAVGASVRGTIVGTTVDPEVGKMQQQHAGTAFDIKVERIEPQRAFAFRWHPFAMGDGDYSKEPMTLVTFALEPQDEGVLLTVTESGFDQIPLERRAQAFTANEGGWSIMVGVIGKYVARSA